jgi:hypothetical protein
VSGGVLLRVRHEDVAAERLDTERREALGDLGVLAVPASLMPAAITVVAASRAIATEVDLRALLGIENLLFTSSSGVDVT